MAIQGSLRLPIDGPQYAQWQRLTQADVKSDMASWASNGDNPHRRMCYGTNKATWPADTCPAGLTADSKGLSVSCLKVLWKAAGCTYFDQMFDSPAGVRDCL